MHELFEGLLANPRDYLQARAGRDFEERFRIGMDRLGYNRITEGDVDASVFANLKESVLDWLAADHPPNPTGFRRHYLFQPYGSQQYPDFLVLDGDRAITIELKFSRGRQGKPMWNSGLPRPCGIYVFGSYSRMEITFFRGVDILPADEAAELHQFFDDLRDRQEAFNREQMIQQEYGFAVYVRKAFDQNTRHNADAVTNFFENPSRTRLQRAVIDHLRRP